jgi:hypothetical protein
MVLEIDQKKSVSKDPSILDLYDYFKKDVTQYNWLGDTDATRSINNLLAAAEKAPKANSFPEIESISGLKRLRSIKLRLSQLRETSVELAHRTRSKRFVISIRDRLQQATPTGTVECSSLQCAGTGLDQLYSIPHCGHIACANCLKS